MIEIISGLPSNVAAFKAIGIITADDYNKTINPLVKKIEKEFGKINYLLVINTALKNYTLGAWIKDALLGFKYFAKWNKLAIVSNEKRIKNFTDFFGRFLPSITKGFMMEDEKIAKIWIVE
ncbi:MAG: STAS/SEC14 domain-containing protein [Ginsengibacter sp.]